MKKVIMKRPVEVVHIDDIPNDDAVIAFRENLQFFILLKYDSAHFAFTRPDFNRTLSLDSVSQYTASRFSKSIQLALDDGKNVYWFEDYNDFLENCQRMLS